MQYLTNVGQPVRRYSTGIPII